MHKFIGEYSMMLEMIHNLYRYNWWAHRRLLEVAKELTLPEMDRNLGGSFPSVHTTFLHMLWVELMFIRRWQGLSTADITEPPLLDSVAAIQTTWEDLEKERTQFLTRLKEADLILDISYIDSRGRSLSLPLWQSLLHLVNHSTYHRGQVASKFRQLEKVPPPTDFVLFCRETN
jgi:uncharacterized damage-inducible protein DinB